MGIRPFKRGARSGPGKVLAGALFAAIVLAAAVAVWLHDSERDARASVPAEASTGERGPARPGLDPAAAFQSEPAKPGASPTALDPPLAVPETAVGSERGTPSASGRVALVRTITGRVLGGKDRTGIAECPVELVRGEGVVVAALTNAEGRFDLQISSRAKTDGLAVRVPTRLDGWIITEPELAVGRPHLERRIELVFHARPWPPPVAGSIRGRLRSETGRWEDLDELLAGNLAMDLISHADLRLSRDPKRPLPRIKSRAKFARRTEASGEVVIEFSFDDVPEGEYELTLSSLGHYRWEPARLFVVPPTEGLEFVRYDLDRTVTLDFDVVDAQTGEKVEGWSARHIRQTISEENGVLFHAGALDLEGFPYQGELTWSLFADGYQPAFGTERDFVEVEEDKLVAHVRLKRGWATRLVALGRDPTMRPLEGATVRVDGKPLGKTDQNGALNLRLDEKPKRIEVEWGGWKALAEVEEPGGTSASYHGHVTPVVLEPGD